MSKMQNNLPKIDLNESIIDEKVAPVPAEPHVELLDDEAVFDGPDQIVLSEAIVTTRADGPVKLIQEPYEPLSIPGLLSQMATKYPHHPAMVSRPGLNGYRKIYNYQDYETDVRSVAKAFIHLGLERHQSVAILGFNSPEWCISYLAAIYAGGIATPVHERKSSKDIEIFLKFCKAELIVVDNKKQVDKIFKIKNNLPNLKAIIQYEGTPDKEDVLSWAEVLEIGRTKLDTQLDAVLKTIAVNKCCTIVFRSGTLGNPKAVMLSHDNFISTARISKDTHQFKEGYEVLVSYLPLSHVAAQINDLILSLKIAAVVHFVDQNRSPESISNTIIFVRPTVILVNRQVRDVIHSKTCLEEGNLNNVITNSDIYTQIIRENTGLVRCRLILTHTTDVKNEINELFNGIGISLINLHRMSECCDTHIFPSNEELNLDSKSKIPKEFKLMLSYPDDMGDQEVLIQGPHVFMGYLNNSEETKKMIDIDGWLKSQKLGKMNDNGFVDIIGGIKKSSIHIDEKKTIYIEKKHFYAKGLYTTQIIIESDIQVTKVNEFGRQLGLIITRLDYYPNKAMHTVKRSQEATKYYFTIEMSTEHKISPEKINEFALEVCEKYLSLV